MNSKSSIKKISMKILLQGEIETDNYDMNLTE